MARMSISKAREKMAEVIELAATEAVILEKHGKPTAVVISYERYDELNISDEDMILHKEAK